jgi:DNA-binding transcriptional MerR regulator
VTEEGGPYVRIGELARRTGTSPDLLRAWERRYGLLQPPRTAGGFRLYSDEDERRVERMQQRLRAGLSAAEAARLALVEPSPERAAAGPGELLELVEGYDEPAAQAVLDRFVASLSSSAVVTDVALPLLHEIGDRWSAGRLSVAQEHFATSVVRGRLLGLARGWGQGVGPRALLASPPGELHDLGLLAFGVLLHGDGWRIVFLGADTPVDSLLEAVAEVRPAIVVLNSVDEARLTDVAGRVAELAREVPVALGGIGATTAAAAAAGALALPEDPLAAVELITQRYGR